MGISTQHMNTQGNAAITKGIPENMRSVLRRQIKNRDDVYHWGDDTPWEQIEGDRIGADSGAEEDKEDNESEDGQYAKEKPHRRVEHTKQADTACGGESIHEGAPRTEAAYELPQTSGGQRMWTKKDRGSTHTESKKAP